MYAIRSYYAKEDADHSLHYMIAVAALDGQVMPAQYEPERIVRSDVQSLLHRVTVVSNPEYSKLFPDKHGCKITVALKDGSLCTKEKADYEGFHTRPMSWTRVEEKFESLADGVIGVITSYSIHYTKLYDDDERLHDH